MLHLACIGRIPAEFCLWQSFEKIEDLLWTTDSVQDKWLLYIAGGLHVPSLSRKHPAPTPDSPLVNITGSGYFKFPLPEHLVIQFVRCPEADYFMYGVKVK
jgi:hypothetical protein